MPNSASLGVLLAVWLRCLVISVRPIKVVAIRFARGAAGRGLDRATVPHSWHAIHEIRAGSPEMIHRVPGRNTVSVSYAIVPSKAVITRRAGLSQQYGRHSKSAYEASYY